MKTKITASCLLLFSVLTFSQDSKSLEGYYDLSEHEAPAHLYLLDDNSFYYYSIFGSVDLEIYGSYTISDNELRFSPREELMQSYILYGRKNEALKDSLAFNYMKSEQDHRFQLVLRVGEQWHKRPIAQIEKDEIYYKVGKPKTDTLTLGYPAQFDAVGNFIHFSEMVIAQIPGGINDFILPYNRYAYIRKRFAKTPMQLQGEHILRGEKTIKKVPLGDGEHEKITAFLKERQMFAPTTDSRGNIFEKIPVVKANRNTKLKADKKGKWVELRTYTKTGIEDENGNFYYDNGELKELVSHYSPKTDGENKFYHENGRVRLVQNFKYGIQNGEVKAFYPNGKLMTLGTYKEGFKEGTWKSYYENGNLKEIENFTEGRLKGAYKKYDKDGTLTEEITF